MKKNSFILSLFTLLVSGLFSQKNVSKINLLPGPVFRMYSVSQERVLTERLTLQTTVRGMPPISFTGFNRTHYNGQEYNPFTGAKLFAIGNFTELRIYGKEKKALRGFYWGPYFHYTYYKLTTATFPAQFKDDNNNVYYADVKQFFKLTNAGGGLQIGLQGVIKNVLVIDWTILGLGISSLGLSGGIEALNTSGNFDFRNYTADVKKSTLGLEKYLPVTKTVEPTKVSVGLRVPTVHIKMGLAIGFGY